MMERTRETLDPAGLAPDPSDAAHGSEPLRRHEAHSHHDDGFHHHHRHADRSIHPGGHHLLQVEDLSIGFRMYDPASPFFKARQSEYRVIDRLSISVHQSEVVAVVGASGSGKTLLADAIMGLYDPNALVTGNIWFDGKLQDGQSLAQLRDSGISLVPQSIDYLDPLMKVGRLVQGMPTGHGRERRSDAKRRQARQRELFNRYGLGPEVADRYPYELSGGMARRVLLCCALMDDPRLIIADEPTPGLDLDLAIRALDDLRGFADEGGGVLLITHDIELALRVADRVAVFHEGTVLEETAVDNFASPELLHHPFSRQLWYALPDHGFIAPDGSDAWPDDGADTVPATSVPMERSDQGEPTKAGNALELPEAEEYPPDYLD